MKKNIIGIILAILVILIIIIIFINNKNTDIKIAEDKVIEVSNENEEYILKDSQTNSVITTVKDKGLLQQYIDDPNYNPYPAGQITEE